MILSDAENPNIPVAPKNIPKQTSFQEYESQMMPVQRAFQFAYFAGICRLRGEAYYQSLANSAYLYASRPFSINPSGSKNKF